MGAPGDPQPYRESLEEAANVLADGAHLNRALKAKTRLVLDTSDAYSGPATTWPYNAAGLTPFGYPTPDNPTPARVAAYGPMDVCEVRLFPPVWRDEPLGPREVQAVLTHEAFHCFMFDLLGIDRFLHLQEVWRALWLVEGAAAWAGETVTGGSALSAGVTGLTPRMWSDYLTKPEVKLFARKYDAIGFFAHLEESGGRPWEHLDEMFETAADSSSEPAYDIAAKAGGPWFLDSWASSYARDPLRGPAWDTAGPGITPDKPTLDSVLTITNGRDVLVSADARASTLRRLDLQADVVRLTVSGDSGSSAHGRLALDATPGDDFFPLTNHDFCTTDSACKCPLGTTGDLDATPISPGYALLAFTGDKDGTQIRLTGLTVDDVCQDNSTAYGSGDAACPYVTLAEVDEVLGTYRGGERRFTLTRWPDDGRLGTCLFDHGQLETDEAGTLTRNSGPDPFAEAEIGVWSRDGWNADSFRKRWGLPEEPDEVPVCSLPLGLHVRKGEFVLTVTLIGDVDWPTPLASECGYAAELAAKALARYDRWKE